MPPLARIAASLLSLALAACGSGDAPGVRPDSGVADPDPVGPDVDGQLVINEFMAKNRLTLVDGTATVSDWIELYNPTIHPIALKGYSVTDDLSHPDKHVLGAGVVVPAGGYLLLWPDGNIVSGPTHLSFQLESAGEAIGLVRPDGSYIDRVEFAEQAVDMSAARVPDGSDRWEIQWHPSPGAPNPSGDGQPRQTNDPSAPPEQVPAAGDVSERLLAYDVMPELEFVLTPEAVAALDSDPRTYVPAQILFEGRSLGPVGVRLKGNNSFQPLSGKAALRVKINRFVPGARFSGLKNMTFNNMLQDASMMHEPMAYWAVRELGLPASRSNHALITINGESYGLYANIETVKREIIARWFDDHEGPLFDNSGKAGDFVASEIPNFSHRDGPDDRSLLLALAEALTIANPDMAIAAAEAYIDVSHFQSFWAMCAVLGQFNSTPYSIPGDDLFMYADPSSGKLWFMPWGFDSTFYSATFDVNQVYSALARKCQNSPACFQGFVDKAWDYLAILENLDWQGERARVADKIAPYVELDTRKPYMDEAVYESQTQMYWFIQDRRFWLGEMLPPHSGKL